MATITNPNKVQPVPVTDADIDALEQLLSEMESEATKAKQSNQVFLNGVYVEIVGVLEPIITKANARIKRERKAHMRKEHKALRKSFRETEEPVSQQGEASEETDA